MIKRIRICDFKSIRELELELNAVTVLVGRSGTGKSNIVQAIRFLRNLLIDLNQAVQHEGGWIRIVPAGEAAPRTSLHVWFMLPGNDQVFQYRIEFAMSPGQSFSPGKDPHLTMECLILGNETLFSRSVEASKGGWRWDKSPPVAAVPHQLGGPMLASFPAVQEVAHAYAALSTGIGYYHMPSTALDRSRSTSAGQQPPKPTQGLWDDASNYHEVMRGIAQDFHHPNLKKNLLATLQKVNPSITSIELDSIVNPQKAVVGHAAGGGTLDLNLEQESDGVRRFYAHLLALYQNPSKLTLIFEEPENAIFPGALSLLADEFKAAPRENRGQVILTTHNPTLLDSFSVDDVRVVELRDGKTAAGPVAKEDRDAVKERLLTTGELLTVGRPKLDDASAQAA